MGASEWIDADLHDVLSPVIYIDIYVCTYYGASEEEWCGYVFLPPDRRFS
jgi:hypothetical protein